MSERIQDLILPYKFLQAHGKRPVYLDFRGSSLARLYLMEAILV